MNRFLREVIKFILIPLLVGLVLFVVFSSVVNSLSKEYQLDPNVNEIFIGDSHIQSSVNDNLLVNVKNLGQSSESLYFSYYKLKRILEENPGVKKVYLGLSYHSLSDYYDKFISGEYSSSVSSHYFYILPVSEQFKLVKWNRNDLSSYFKSVIKKGKRSIFNEIDNNYFSGYSNDFINSSAIDTSMEKRLKFQYYTDGKLNDFSQINLLYLTKIVDLCKEKNVDLVLLNSPLHSFYLSRIPEEYIRMYKKIISENNLKLLDLSEMKMDDSSYTPDGDHVSIRGSVMMTNELRKIQLNASTIINN